ncbi:MAG TPA: S-layer homology domain-containing protein [Acidimicrobiia bacterium]
MAQGEPIAAGVQTLNVELPDVNARGAVLDVSVEVGNTVLDDFVALGAEIIEVSERYDHVRLRIVLSQVEALAAIPQVSFVGPKRDAITSRVDGPAAAISSLGDESVDALRERKLVDRAETLASIKQALQVEGALPNAGSQDSEGNPKHRANTSRAAYGVNGSGVRIGVLSDGVGGLATSQALGDLGPVTVLPGQGGSGAEGTAMLEIIHDLAPGAELLFATAFTSIESFADNIRALRAAGSDIIVDDVGYFVETPFQDGQTTPSITNGGIVVQAVKDVVADGALFFSAAANSGNLNDGTSGTWEGDFVDGGAGSGVLTGAGQLHDFGGQLFNVVTATTPNPVTLHWADPLGGSANDYDIYILNNIGTVIFDASTNAQNGTQDPFEATGGAFAAERIVIVRSSGLDRFLHLSTNRGRLAIATGGDTHGHAATTAANSFGVAATSAQVNGSNPFNGSHVVETYSSDGPRRIFFQGNGAAITPGNFTATGGQVLQKPDFTAADDVSVTGVGGFPSPFQGTSAAAPHAAAIAALVQSRFPNASPSIVRNALFASAIDIEAAGIDRDSGRGIIMANRALASLANPPSVSSHPANRTIPSGGTATLNVTASGTPVLRYQWYRGTSGNTTTPVAGATAKTFTTAALTTTARFWVRVTNPVGAANSTTATITVSQPPAGQRFVDVPPSHVFFSAIDWLAAERITLGCNPPINDRFCPADSVSRGQMAGFLGRALDLSSYTGPDRFVDDDGNVFEGAIERLAQAGITVGCNPPANDRFCPANTVSRGQMAAFLVRALDLPAYTGPNRFSDDNGHVFEGAIERLAQAGITVGCNPPANDRFCPNDPVNRAQMAGFLRRALD